ncbi:hypothetical protein AAG906_020534 [Vitis piasezkii]
MRTTLLRRCQEGSLRSDSLVKKPHFFKIIHPALLRDGKLGFPKRFVRRYGKNLSKFIFLKTPSGAEWAVQLVKRDDEIEYPSTNATHDEDQPNNNNGLCQCPNSEENGDDVSVEILDDFPASQTAKKNDGFSPSQETRKKRKSSSLPSTEKRRRNPSRKTDNPLKLRSFRQHFQSEGIQASGTQFEKLKTDVDLHLSKYMDGLKFNAKEGGGGMHTTKRCKLSQALAPLAASEEVGALRRAKAFKTKNPFFIVTMQPTYVTRRYKLNIPLRFVKRHFEKNNNTATLLVPAGRTWPVKCSVAKTDVKFSRGWRNFVVDNCLEVGDVCAFEMIKCTGTLLKVVIFRKNEVEGACCSGSSI